MPDKDVIKQATVAIESDEVFDLVSLIEKEPKLLSFKIPAGDDESVSGCSLLMYALKHGRLTIARILCLLGASLTLINAAGETAFAYAKKRNIQGPLLALVEPPLEKLKRFVRLGMSVGSFDYKAAFARDPHLLNAPLNNEGDTFFFICVREKRLEDIDYLLYWHSIDLDYSNYERHTVIDVASFFGHVKLYQKLESLRELKKQLRNELAASNARLLKGWLGLKLSAWLTSCVNAASGDQTFNFLECYESVALLHSLEEIAKHGDSSFIELLRKLINQRETIICDTAYDYCVRPNSPVNRFFIGVAERFKEELYPGAKNHWDVLLYNSMRKDSDEPWQDSDLDESLAAGSDFFRTRADGLNRYQDVLNLALVNLGEGYRSAEYLFYSCDAAFAQKPLTAISVAMLQARVPKLKAVHELTNKQQDSVCKLYVDNSYYAKLSQLQTKLKECSVLDKGKHDSAESSIYSYLDDFFREWRSFPEEHRERIEALSLDSQGPSSNTIGSVLEILQNDKPRKQSNIGFCLQLKFHTLRDILQKPHVQAELQKLGQETMPSPEKLVDLLIKLLMISEDNMAKEILPFSIIPFVMTGFELNLMKMEMVRQITLKEYYWAMKPAQELLSDLMSCFITGDGAHFNFVLEILMSRALCDWVLYVYFDDRFRPKILEHIVFSEKLAEPYLQYYETMLKNPEGSKQYTEWIFSEFPYVALLAKVHGLSPFAGFLMCEKFDELRDFSKSLRPRHFLQVTYFYIEKGKYDSLKSLINSDQFLLIKHMREGGSACSWRLAFLQGLWLAVEMNKKIITHELLELFASIIHDLDFLLKWEGNCPSNRRGPGAGAGAGASDSQDNWRHGAEQSGITEKLDESLYQQARETRAHFVELVRPFLAKEFAKFMASSNFIKDEDFRLLAKNYADALADPESVKDLCSLSPTKSRVQLARDVYRNRVGIKAQSFSLIQKSDAYKSRLAALNAVSVQYNLLKQIVQLVKIKARLDKVSKELLTQSLNNSGDIALCHKAWSEQLKRARKNKEWLMIHPDFRLDPDTVCDVAERVLRRIGDFCIAEYNFEYLTKQPCFVEIKMADGFVDAAKHNAAYAHYIIEVESAMAMKRRFISNMVAAHHLTLIATKLTREVEFINCWGMFSYLLACFCKLQIQAEIKRVKIAISSIKSIERQICEAAMKLFNRELEYCRPSFLGGRPIEKDGTKRKLTTTASLAYKGLNEPPCEDFKCLNNRLKLVSGFFADRLKKQKGITSKENMERYARLKSYAGMACDLLDPMVRLGC